jgi:putative PEP-CTERM system TPR-repeat lipoprotein
MKMKNNVIKKALLVSAIAVIIGCSPKTPEEFIASANQYLVQNNPDSAIIELKNAVSASPQNAELRFLLGEIYYSQNILDAAEKELQRAVDLGASDKDVLPLLIKIHYYKNDFDVAQNLADKASVTSENELSSIKLFGYLAGLRSPSANFDNLAFPTDLKGDDNILAQTYQALVSGDVKNAEQFYSTFESPEHEKAEKLYVFGLIKNKQQQFEEAVAAFKAVLVEMPNLSVVKFQLAEALISAKSMDEAAKVTNELLALNKENAYSNHLKAGISFAQQDFETAFFHAEKAIQNGFKSKPAFIIAGTSALKLQKFGSAYRYLQQAAEDLDKGHIVHRLLANTQLLLGYTDEAGETLDGISDLQPLDSLLFADTAIRLAQIGDLEKAKDFMGKANLADGKNAAYQLYEGLLKITTGDQNAIANIESAIDSDPALKKAWMTLAQNYLREGKPALAFKVADDWQVIAPADSLTLRGYIFQSLKQPEQAIDAFKQALLVDSTHMGANQLLMNTYAKQQDFDKAIDIAKKILTFAPDDLRSLAALIQFNNANNNTAAELKVFFEQHVDQYPQLSSPKIALALFYGAQNEPQRAIQLLNQHQDSLNSTGLMLLGDTALQAKDISTARDTYQKMRSAFPNDIRGWQRCIGIEEITNNISGAYELTLQAQKTFPHAAQFKLLMLNYLTKLGRLDDANRVLIEIKQTSSQNSTLTKFEGELALAKKDYNQAEKLLEKNYQHRPSFITATSLAQAMQLNGNFEKAANMLEKEFAKLSNPVKQRHTMAEFYRFNEAHKRAVHYYLAAIQANSKDYVAYNNLAFIQLELGSPTKALASAQKAFELAPNIPVIEDTLGWMYFKNQEVSKAEQHLTSAYKKLPGSEEIAFHLAEVLKVVGKQPEAEQVPE